MDHRRIEMESGRPDARLRGQVLAYTGFRERAPRPLTWREVPDASATLVFTFGEPLDVRVQQAPGPPDGTYEAFLAGLHDRPAFVGHPGRQYGVKVTLTPFGAYRLLGVAMHEAVNTALDLADVLGRRAPSLTARLAEARSWGARFAILDEALTALAAQGPAPSTAVVAAWGRLVRSGGRTRIAGLAGEAGRSRRRFADRFRAEVGLSPKVVARVLRFRRALRRLEWEREGSLAGVAVSCGYFDQSHMNREFRALAGCAPTELMISRPSVPFVQDGAGDVA